MLPGLSDPFWAGLLATMLAVAAIVVAVPGQRLTSTPSIWGQRQCCRGAAPAAARSERDCQRHSPGRRSWLSNRRVSGRSPNGRSPAILLLQDVGARGIFQ